MFSFVLDTSTWLFSLMVASFRVEKYVRRCTNSWQGTWHSPPLQMHSGTADIL